MRPTDTPSSLERCAAFLDESFGLCRRRIAVNPLSPSEFTRAERSSMENNSRIEFLLTFFDTTGLWQRLLKSKMNVVCLRSNVTNSPLWSLLTSKWGFYGVFLPAKKTNKSILDLEFAETLVAQAQHIPLVESNSIAVRHLAARISMKWSILVIVAIARQNNSKRSLTGASQDQKADFQELTPFGCLAPQSVTRRSLLKGDAHSKSPSSSAFQ